MSKVITDKMLDRIYVKLTNDLQRKPKATKKEIVQMYICRLNGNFKPMYETKLYNKHSTEYCRLLEIINWYFE
jgi:hypothetical protein